MIMNRYALLMVLAASTTCFAQQDPKAVQILDEVTQATKSYTSLRADFAYSMENKAEGIREEYTGKAVIAGKKYHLNIPKLGMEVFCDGVTVRSYNKDANEVTVNSIEDESVGLLNPATLLSLYQKDFTGKFVKESVVGGRKVCEIDLLPSTDSEYSSVRIHVDRQQKMITYAEMKAKDGITYTLTVSNLKVNTPVADSEFTFDRSKYPDVEEVDLR